MIRNNNQSKFPTGKPNASPEFSIYVNLKNGSIIDSLSNKINFVLTKYFENWSINTTVIAGIILYNVYTIYLMFYI